jgi:hypothetical protein
MVRIKKKLAGHAARIEERRSVYSNLVIKTCREGTVLGY